MTATEFLALYTLWFAAGLAFSLFWYGTDKRLAVATFLAFVGAAGAAKWFIWGGA